MTASTPELSIVVPVYNESSILERLISELKSSVEAIPGTVEIVFINDGSTDRSPELLNAAAQNDRTIHVVHLTRNFGQQPALMAGLMYASGKAIVILDADMQDDSRAIKDMYDAWARGNDVVYAIRTNRKEHVLKRCLFFLFYRLLNAISRTPIPKDAGAFGLIDRRVANAITRIQDTDCFYPGLRSWVGFKQIGIPTERSTRYDECPRVSLLGLCRLAKTAIFNFSSAPLMIFYAAAIISLAAFTLTSSFVLYHKWYTGLAIPGWTSTILISSFFGAINALGIAILGEYVVRIHDQVRSRPRFIVGHTVNCDTKTHTEINECNINP